MKTRSALGIFLFFITGFRASGQLTTDLVGKLVSAENYFAARAKESGIPKAFLSVSDDETIIFRPGPVKAKQFYKERKEEGGILTWEPVFARVSKSDDWGFTTGPFTFRRDSGSTPSYGEYFSLWRKNRKGTWKLALDIGVPHPKPVAKPKLQFLNPENERFIHQYGTKRQQQREDIITSSDKLFATILKADNKIARKEFLADDVRLLFPGQQPLIGKAKVSEFWDKMQVKVNSEPVYSDRSFSGELALTYGTATIESKGKSSIYYYVRVWEIQPGYQWNVILEIFAPN